MLEFVYLVLWFERAACNCECFPSRELAEEFAKTLRDQGKDPWHDRRPVRSAEFVKLHQG